MINLELVGDRDVVTVQDADGNRCRGEAHIDAGGITVDGFSTVIKVAQRGRISGKLGAVPGITWLAHQPALDFDEVS